MNISPAVEILSRTFLFVGPLKVNKCTLLRFFGHFQGGYNSFVCLPVCWALLDERFTLKCEEVALWDEFFPFRVNTYWQGRQKYFWLFAFLARASIPLTWKIYFPSWAVFVRKGNQIQGMFLPCQIYQINHAFSLTVIFNSVSVCAT